MQEMRYADAEEIVKPTRKIDIHTHILPREIPSWKDRFGYGGFIRLEHQRSCGTSPRALNGAMSSAPCSAKMLLDDGRFFREIESNCWDPQVRIRECDENLVDLQVLSTVPVMFSYWAKPRDGLEIARFLNDQIKETVERHPSRFVGLGTLPMQAPELAIQELARCMKDLGFAGVQMGSHVNQWNLSDPEVFPVFQAAEKLGAAIFVHPWDMMGQERMPKYWLPWLVGMPAELSLAICSLIFGGVFERLPKLRVAFAHGGGSFGATLGRIEHGFVSRPDLCAVDNPVSPRAYLGRFFVDSLVHDSRMLRYLIDLYGEDAIVLGSDYPFPLGETKPGQLVESLGLESETKSKILYENAMRWLGREEK